MNALMILLAIITGAVFLMVLLAAPKWLALTLWPVIMVYPHAVTYGKMPMNVGIDDLYISLVFVVLTIRLGFPRFSFPLKAAIIFYFILLISNLTGVLVAPTNITQRVLKESIKSLVFIMFTWTMLISIRDEKDIQLHVMSFIISVTVASLIAVADHFGALFAQLFYIVEEEKLHFRAYGPFLSPGGIGLTTMMPIFISFTGFAIIGKYFYKTLLMFGAGIIGTALFVSGSRSGWIGFSLGLLAMFVTTRRRIILFVAGCLVVVAAVYFLPAGAIERVVRINIERTLYGIGAGTAGRLGRWLDYAKHPYLGMLLCGRGIIASQALGFDTPHNGYLDIVFLFGLGGIIYFGVIMRRLFRLSRWLAKNDFDPLFSVLGQGIFIGMVGWLGVAVAADPPLNTFWRYSFFFTISLLWSRQEILQAMGMFVPYPSKHVHVRGELDEYSYEEGYLDYT